MLACIVVITNNHAVCDKMSVYESECLRVYSVLRAGFTGPAGSTGFSGPEGSTGFTGNTGLNGATGPRGATGATGPQGPDGFRGSPGAPGAPGALGATGSTGPTGSYFIQQIVSISNVNKLRCESTTNPVPVLRIAASRGLSNLTKNVTRSSHGHSTPSLKISCKSVQRFARNVAGKEISVAALRGFSELTKN